MKLKSILFSMLVAAMQLSAQNSTDERTGNWTTNSMWSTGTYPGTLTAGTISIVSKTVTIREQSNH